MRQERIAAGACGDGDRAFLNFPQRGATIGVDIEVGESLEIKAQDTFGGCTGGAKDLDAT